MREWIFIALNDWEREIGSDTPLPPALLAAFVSLVSIEYLTGHLP